MPLPDFDAVFGGMIDAVKRYTERAVDPVRTRIDGLEVAVRGLASPDFVRAEVASAKSTLTLDLLGALSKAPDGKTITVEDVQPLIEARLAALPVPKDGAPGEPGPAGAAGEPGKDGEPGPIGARGADGASVDPALVEAMLAAEVARMIPAISEPAREASEARVNDLADAFVAQLMAATVEQR